MSTDVSSRTIALSIYSKTPAERAQPSFEMLHAALTDKLTTSKYVKAVDVNLLFHCCQSLEELEKAKATLARFRKSPSHSRNSQPTSVFKACLRLGVPEDALKMAMDPVQYGLFPMNNAMHTLLMAFVSREDFQGVKKIIQLMKQREMNFTGKQHFLIAKTSLKSLLKVHKKGDIEEKGEMVEGIEEKETADEDENQRKIKLEDLEPTLEFCKECYLICVDRGSRAFYFVNGTLLDLGMVQLSSEMLEKLETESFLPEKLILNMKMVNRRVCDDLAGVLSLLQTMQAKGLEVTRRSLPKLQEAFASSKDQNIRQSFLDLKITF